MLPYTRNLGQLIQVFCVDSHQNNFTDARQHNCTTARRHHVTKSLRDAPFPAIDDCLPQIKPEGPAGNHNDGGSLQAFIHGAVQFVKEFLSKFSKFLETVSFVDTLPFQRVVPRVEAALLKAGHQICGD